MIHPAYEEVHKLSDAFADAEGRRPRMLIASIPQDTPGVNIRRMASGLADLGFDVDIAPQFQAPAALANQAAENDVHIIGLFGMGDEYNIFIPQLSTALKHINRPDIMILAANALPAQEQTLLGYGAALISSPDTAITHIAKEILLRLMDNRQ